MIHANDNTKSTYGDAAADVSSGFRPGVTEGVIQQPDSPLVSPANSPGRKRPGNGGPAGHRRNRAAEQAAKAIRYSLSLPTVGKAAETIRKRTAGLRRALEAEVMAARGAISLSDAAAIASACTAERYSSLAAMWLRKDGEKLSPSERLAHAKATVDGSERRDKAITSLRLPGGLTEAAGGNAADFYASLKKSIEQPEVIEQPAQQRPLEPRPTSPAAPHGLQTVPLDEI